MAGYEHGYRRQDLTPLLNARSVAIVGVSGPGRFGGILFENLLKFGYTGQIHLVNPRYESLYDRPCYPSLHELPETPDCALLAAPNHRLVEALQEVADCRIPAAVIFANAHSDPGDEPALQSRLKEIALEHGVVLCGPNCMGFVSLAKRLPVSGYITNGDTPAGGVTLITHSGSVWDAALQNQRGVAFNYIVSAGNEVVTSMADYMQFALDDPSTRVIGLFLETVRDPKTFIAALAEAADRDIPVVVLKTGRTERGAEMARAHSGALAGEDGVYDALFVRYGVRRVASIDEMMDTLELFASGIRPHNRSVSALLDSGGQRALLVDLAEAAGVEFALIDAETKEKLDKVLEPGLEPTNPLDAFGTGNDFEEIYAKCLLALDADPETGLTLLAVDLYPNDDATSPYPAIVASVQDRLTKPLAILTHMSAATSQAQSARLRAMGVPVLLGTETGLRATAHVVAYRNWQRTRRRSEVLRAVAQPANLPLLRQQIRDAPDALDEHASKLILQAFGISTTREVEAATLDEALRAADEIGYPVALKSAGGALHKTESGGVRLDLATPEQLSAAYRDLEARLGPRTLVQEMIQGGTELILGIVVDPQFGPMLTLGTGGIFVEVLKDVTMLTLPTTPDAVRDALHGLRGVALLQGARGRAPADIEAVVAAAMGLAALAADLGDTIAAIDINPLIALPGRAVAVDALIVPARSE